VRSFSGNEKALGEPEAGDGDDGLRRRFRGDNAVGEEGLMKSEVGEAGDDGPGSLPSKVHGAHTSALSVFTRSTSSPRAKKPD